VAQAKQGKEAVPDIDDALNEEDDDEEEEKGAAQQVSVADFLNSAPEEEKK